MGKKKISKKLLAALALGMLVVSGFAITSTTIESPRIERGPYGVFKDVRDNPFNLINGENLALPNNFDYIEEMNREFIDFSSDKEASYLPGDSLKESEGEV